MSEQRKKRGNASSRGRANSGEQSHQQRSNQNSNRSKMNQNYKRQTSFDQVRKIVQEEGRSARNLITWNVPLDDDGERRQQNVGGPPRQSQNYHPRHSESHDDKPHPQQRNQRSHSAHGRPLVENPERTSSRVPRPQDLGTGFSGISMLESNKHGESADSNGLNSSQNSQGTQKKSDLRARYWAFLFDNLRRAVDEIYTTCETDESVVECKEVIMMLEQCTKDFQSLIERHKLLKAFEAADEDNKPHSLAWEVRKSSPGKGLVPTNAKDFTPSPTVARSLNFNLPPQVQRQPVGNSWADRVKGIVPKAHPIEVISKSEQTESKPPIVGLTGCSDVLTAVPQETTPERKPVENEEDLDGWETVQRNGRTKRPLSAGNGSQNQQNNMRNTDKKYQRAVSIDASAIKIQSSPDTNKDIKANPKTDESLYRNRTSSHDSEKENLPWASVIKTSPATSKSEPQINKLVSPDPGIIVQGPLVRRERSEGDFEHVMNMGCISKSVDVSPYARDGGCDMVRDKVNADDKLVLSDDDDDDDDEAYNHALASVLDAEDDISSELEKEQEAALESALREEETYLQEIAREESMEVDVETETETESDLGNTASTAILESSLQQRESLDWDTMVMQFEADAEQRKTTSWADMVDDTETRTPGRVVHMHEKLSSPSRKRSLTEKRRHHEEKQAKAQELRDKLQQEKSERLRTLTKKVEEVRELKDNLMQERIQTMERKLQRAEEKRQLQLKIKVRKAHEEENKANEIAFINTLEAQNKRHDIFTKYQESEARLQDIQEERQRRHEEKLAKEAAVEERRRVLHAERQARLHEMQQKRRQREEVIEQRLQEKEKERLEAARAKERGRDERIAALNAQQQAHIVELQKKIRVKQEESGRRHKEQLELIQEKAFSMSILRHSTEDHNEAPKLVPYERQKLCNVCNVMIPSEVHLSSHLRGKKHKQSLMESTGGKDLSKQEIEEFNLTHIADAPSDKPDPRVASEKERQKALKKRCKKLRQRMSQRGTEYEGSLSSKLQTLESDHKAKLQKIIKDLNKYLQGQDKGPWPQNKVSALDRGLGEIGRILEKKNLADQNTFRIAGGLTTFCRVLLVIGDTTSQLPSVIPHKSLIHCCTVFRLACKGCYDSCHYMLFCNKAGSLVDMLNHQLNMLDPENLTSELSSSGGASSLRLPHDPLATSLLQLIAVILTVLAKHNPSVNSSEASAERMSTSGDAFMSRANDIVSYIISVGILDKLTQYFNNVRGSIDNQPQAADFLQHSMGFLIAMIRIISKRNANIFDTRKKDDTTQLIATFQVTGLVGIVSLMYGMLLHSGAPSRGESAPPELPGHSLSVATVGFRMLNHLAQLDLQLLQGSLGEEGTSLEFRHIASYLLWYCSHWSHEELLHEVMLCVGYFTVLNPDNQVIIQSGQPLTVLQQLCMLPFQYFSDPKLTSVLFPTLITCCYNNTRNRDILEQELSCTLLSNFIEEKTLEGQTKQSPTTTKKGKAPDKEAELRMSFGCRFPPEEWANAQDYFNVNK